MKNINLINVMGRDDLLLGSWETFDFECPGYVKEIGDNLICYHNIIK